MNLKFITFSLSVTYLTGCASIPQKYDSPIPVYVDLGNNQTSATQNSISAIATQQKNTGNN